MADLVLRVPDSTALALPPAPAVERARAYARSAISDNTHRSYDGAWRRFVAWCRAARLAFLPTEPTTLAAYIGVLADAGMAAATIDVALSAIAKAHRLAGEASPRGAEVVLEVRRGVRRTIGTAQHGKAPLLAGALRAELATARPGKSELAALRNHAMLLVGWTGAFRRSELVALNVEDLRQVPEGLELHLGRSKTDQEGKGRVLPIPRARSAELCPDRVLRAWLAAAHITEGALFRSISRWGRVGKRLSGAAVATVAKEAAVAAGLDPREFAGHSLRSGLATQAARAGRSLPAIMKITGHVSTVMVLRYIRESERWRDVASEGLLDDAR